MALCSLLVLQCKPCAPGSFVNTTGRSVCASCARGSFQDHSGRTACLPCNFGCVPCWLGCSPLASGAEVDWCVCSFFGSSPGLAECKTCGVGTHSSVQGAEGCQQVRVLSAPFAALKLFLFSQCDPGSYQDEEGQRNCKACPIGSSTPSAAQYQCGEKCSSICLRTLSVVLLVACARVQRCARLAPGRTARAQHAANPALRYDSPNQCA